MRGLILVAALWALSACAASSPRPEATPPAAPAPPPVASAPAPPPAAPPPAAAPPGPAPPPVAAPAPTPLPEQFESEDFVLVLARPGDTAETLAARVLGDPTRAWMIDDYREGRPVEPGQWVAIPRRPWNPSGVEATGYQLVPILCYHNLGPQSRGRLVLGIKAFEEQMRYLKAEGYRVVSLREFLEFTALKRQLPRKTVVLTFDDGWKSFRELAHPILKELGFRATLFIYSDFVGARLGLSWQELRELAAEGYDIQAHSKTHNDMRRKPEEGDAEYAARMQAELVQPLALFQRQLGATPTILAYPYGAHDDDVVKRTREAGYVAALDVRRQANPAFSPPLTIHRSQVYSEMTLDDFKRNLNVFHEEALR
jgi:peptidoglycan/xylan/chitin deacetylase (PgdA/CDA1 family)